MRPVLFGLLLAATLFTVISAGTARGAGEGLSIDPVVWEFSRDYPEFTPGDGALPINRVYLKTHDGTDWMSVYDEHPQAVNGPDALRRAIDTYRAQGIDVVAWFVPKGWDIETQLIMAGQVLESGVSALYADIEPFPGFCDLDCPFLASQFWPRLRERYPTADLGVIYDPRPVNWERSGLFEWMRPANTALPMCYWSSFVDQPPWNDPAGCVKQARADLGILAPGGALQYVPMLQGDAPADQVRSALIASTETGASRASIWRRGVISSDTWSTIAAYRAEVDAKLAAPPDPCLFAHMRLGRRAGLC